MGAARNQKRAVTWVHHFTPPRESAREGDEDSSICWWQGQNILWLPSGRKSQSTVAGILGTHCSVWVTTSRKIKCRSRTTSSTITQRVWQKMKMWSSFSRGWPPPWWYVTCPSLPTYEDESARRRLSVLVAGGQGLQVVGVVHGLQHQGRRFSLHGHDALETRNTSKLY